MNQIFRIVLFVFLLINTAIAQVDFRKESIYFLMTTRFFDGDTSNSAPTEWCSYIPGVNNPNLSDPKDVTWRGDFKGLVQQLDYIKGMGFTAIWITPIVQNRGPLDYHGYHAWDFTKVDPRLESTGVTFKDLCDAAHAKGMKIILDIVTNHAGRYGVKGQAELKYNTDPTKPWGQDLNGRPLKDNPNWEYDGLTPNPDDGKIWSRANLAKMPPPFNENLSLYNWPSTQSFLTTSDPNWYNQVGNGFVQGWDDTLNCYYGSIAGDCADLKTSSATVRDYFFQVYKTYIDMGVDGFRWDTWKHMPKQDIIHLYDRFKAYKPDLFVFGEVAQKRFELHPVEELNPHWYTWRGAVGSSPKMDYGVLDFYGEATFHNIFENGGAFSGVTDAARYDNLYADPSLLVTWLDNHDFGPNNDWNRRYGGSEENLAACMNFMFTWRGIPCVYYGTEMQFMKGAYTDIHEPSSIQKSIDLTGRAYYGDNVKTAVNHRLYKHLAKLNAIRKAIPALQNGSWEWGGNYPGNGIGYIRKTGAQTVCVGLAKDGDANFNFTSVPNGMYRDAVTGREVNVTNGRLQFNVKSLSAGIYVLNGPGMIGESGLGFFEPCVTGCAPLPKTNISPVGDNYTKPITVTISANDGAGSKVIYYTTDGSTPTTSSTVYSGAFSVNTATVVKAIARDANGKISEVAAQRYTFVQPKPKLNITPASGNYFDPIKVELTASNGTSPYKIYYTTDGSTPNESGSLYGTPLTISTATTIRAIAVDSNAQVSSVVSAQYTFNIPAPVVSANPSGGNFPTPPVNVTLTAVSPRPPVSIFYTTDGTTPTISSTLYSTPVSLDGSNPVTLKYIARDNEGRISAVDSQRYTFNPIPDIWVYFKRPVGWGANIRCYYWNALPQDAMPAVAWPGILMEPVCTGGNWYKFRFNGVTSVNVIFTDGAGKQTPNLVNVNKTQYYDNGWLSVIPEIEKPVADFSMTPSSGAAPLTVNFNASASSGCGNLTYFWDFGNGNTDNSIFSPSSTYTNPGNYFVRLIIRDANGASDTLTKSIKVDSASSGMSIHFKRPNNWTNTPRLYFWNTQPSVATIGWPGVEMENIGDGWWRYRLNGVNCTNLIFNNNSSPQTPDLYKCGDCWYDGGWVNGIVTSVSQIQSKSGIALYPNPVRSMVGVRHRLQSGTYTLRLSDISGKILSVIPLRMEVNQTYWFSRNHLQLRNGMVLIQLLDEKGMVRANEKLIVE